MTSLRTRLVAVALIVAAAGLIFANLGVYRVVRHDLDSRMDAQLLYISGRRFIGRFIEGTPSDLFPGSGLAVTSHQVADAIGSGAAAAAAGTTDAAGGAATTVPFDRGRTSARPPRSAFDTYAELRDETGRSVADPIRLSPSDSDPTPLVLPAVLGPPPTLPRIFEAKDRQGRRHRVVYRRIESGAGFVYAIPTVDRDATLHKLLRVQWIASIVALFAMAILSAVLVRLGLRPLRRIEDSAATIASGDLSHRIGEAGSDRTEVGRLRTSLNSMLVQIEVAFAAKEESQAQLKRFVADASHELRTPLTSIKGYAELYRRGIARDGEALDSSMRRIESEAGRMTALVEDMLTLARLDQGRAVVPEPVDVESIVRDAVADFRTVEPSRPFELRVEGSPWVSGEPHRLMQVISNLLANARVHTPVGALVEVEVHEEAAAAVVAVRDHGPGIDPTEQGHLFEPFYRTDPARTRARGARVSG